MTESKWDSMFTYRSFSLRMASLGCVMNPLNCLAWSLYAYLVHQVAGGHLA